LRRLSRAVEHVAEGQEKNGDSFLKGVLDEVMGS
jgi:hypothetical protein